MASREGQGLQIAVILFAILTVVLAVTTYMFYTQAEKARKEVEAAKKSAEEANKFAKNANFEAAALKYMLGYAPKGEMDAAKSGASDDSGKVAGWIADFDKAMLLVGETVANEEMKSYRGWGNFFIGELTKKNKSLVDEQAVTATTQKEKESQVNALTGKNEEQAGQLLATQTKYTAEVAAKEDESKRVRKEKEELASKIAVDEKKAKKDLTDLQMKYDEVAKVNTTVTGLVTIQKDKIKELEKEGGLEILTNPDGKIVWISQKQQLVWIDLGFADGLSQQTTFAVFDNNQSTMFKNDPPKKTTSSTKDVSEKSEPKIARKARIEVVRVLGDHQAECRILEDKPSNPIVPGDWIQSPAWSPGQRQHFALIGFMDVNADGISDRELVRNVILLNGGVIDADLSDEGVPEGKITPNTRFLVEGVKPNEKGAPIPKDPKKLMDEYQAMQSLALQNGLQKISLKRLLDQMGWKQEEKTVGLGKNADALETGFRKRSAAVKAADAKMEKPAASEAPAGDAKPAGGEKTEKGGKPADAADPFGEAK